VKKSAISQSAEPLTTKNTLPTEDTEVHEGLLKKDAARRQ